MMHRKARVHALPGEVVAVGSCSIPGCVQPNPFCAPVKANVSIGEPDCVAAGGGS